MIIKLGSSDKTYKHFVMARKEVADNPYFGIHLGIARVKEANVFGDAAY